MTNIEHKKKLLVAAKLIVSGRAVFSCSAIGNGFDDTRSLYEDFYEFTDARVQPFEIENNESHGRSITKQSQLARSLALLFFRESL